MTASPAAHSAPKSASRKPEKNLSIEEVPHPGQWVATGFVLLILAIVVRILVTNGNFQWDVVRQYLFSSVILDGLLLTLELTAVCMVVGVTFGVVLAVMRRSANPVVARAAGVYIWFFRGTPVLVQLIFWYNLAALFPTIRLGIPFGGPAFAHLSANSLITPFTAAVLGLGLNEGAYMAEIVRAGILSVDEGQTDAGRALGMSRMQIMRRIVLPQAMRFIIPPTGNETIGMLKMTSLVSVIALADLLYSAQFIYSQNFETIPLLLVVSIWYLAVTTVLTFGQTRLERRFNRSEVGAYYGRAEGLEGDRAASRRSRLPGWLGGR
jgi:polar amino acid transport system permease protein